MHLLFWKASQIQVVLSFCQVLLVLEIYNNHGFFSSTTNTVDVLKMLYKAEFVRRKERFLVLSFSNLFAKYCLKPLLQKLGISNFCDNTTDT